MAQIRSLVRLKWPRIIFAERHHPLFDPLLLDKWQPFNVFWGLPWLEPGLHGRKMGFKWAEKSYSNFPGGVTFN